LIYDRAQRFANEEWDQLGLFKRMSLNKEEFIKSKSEKYFQNHFGDIENENEREDGDEKEEEERKIREEEEEERKIREEEERKIREEEEERKIREDEKEEEERKIREEEERKIREDFISSSDQLQVLFQIISIHSFFQIRPLYYLSSKIVNLPS